jgi:hypothetical protein
MTNQEFEATLEQTRESEHGQGEVGRMGWNEPPSTRDYPNEPAPAGLDDTDPSPAASDQPDADTGAGTGTGTAVKADPPEA